MSNIIRKFIKYFNFFDVNNNLFYFFKTSFIIYCSLIAILFLWFNYLPTFSFYVILFRDFESIIYNHGFVILLANLFNKYVWDFVQIITFVFWIFPIIFLICFLLIFLIFNLTNDNYRKNKMFQYIFYFYIFYSFLFIIIVSLKGFLSELFKLSAIEPKLIANPYLVEHIDRAIEQAKTEPLVCSLADQSCKIVSPICKLISHVNFYYAQLGEVPFIGSSVRSGFSSTINGDFCLAGLDSLSLLFVGLTILLVGLCFILVRSNIVSEPLIIHYIVMIWLLIFLLNVVFLTQNLLVFFIAFECVLLPIVYLIGIWGSPSRRQANNYLIFYTTIGAIPIILVVFYLWALVGSSQNLTVGFLSNLNFSIYEERFLWLGLFLSFAIKTPMVPVHIWLPKAHVDASTTGSVILAGLLLKIGLFGIVKFLMPIFPQATIFFAPYVSVFATIGVLYASMVTLWQIDIKRIIAYSSVAHINLALASIFSLSSIGVIASIFIILSHGIISSALFFLVGFLYNRFHQRGVIYYGGLSLIMPIFSTFFFFFLLSNIAFPLTIGFIGEFLCLSGIIFSNTFLGILNAFSIFFTTAYSILLFNRVCFGTLPINFEILLFKFTRNAQMLTIHDLITQQLFFTNMHKKTIKTLKVQTLFNSVAFQKFDLNSFEVFIVSILTVLTLLGGIFPQAIFYFMNTSLFFA